MVYPGSILKIRVRGSNKKDYLSNSTPDASSFEEVSVVLPGMIARFDGSDIRVIAIFFIFVIFLINKILIRQCLLM